MPSNLNYCKNCGSRNEKNALVVGNSSSKIMGVAATFVAIVGLVGFVEMLKLLLNSRLETPALIAVLVVYLIAVFAMFAVLVGHVWKKSGDIRIKTNEQADEYAPPEFRRVTTAQLVEPRDMPASVTEHTTRTLDEVVLNRK